jgi:soluble lytic murein transglycosylase-like protein
MAYTYRQDVAFLEDCNPPLVERNALEFKRLRDLLLAVEPGAKRAATHTQWVSQNRKPYDNRLREARDLITHLADGYDKAQSALLHYASALVAARSHYSDGKAAEQTLAGLISRVADAETRTAQEAGPMRQWEDLRGTTGFLDWAAELTVDIDDIKDEANRAHDQASAAYHRARTVESEARDTCTEAMDKAYKALPDFRGGDFADAKSLIDAIPALRTEVAEARRDSLTRLPGSGAKAEFTTAVGKDDVSPSLMDIRMRLTELPEATDAYWAVPRNAEERREWIAANSDIITAAAQRSGLPRDMVAGIAWQEVGGQWGWMDDGVDTVRELARDGWLYDSPESLPSRLGGSPDETSFGPIAIQVRRAAEVLGYDPAHLTDSQRDTIEASLQDPGQNIFIASEYLAMLKEESDFADVPADEMTGEQRQELAARYNGGPYWQDDKAQAYGRGFDENLDDARSALK